MSLDFVVGLRWLMKVNGEGQVTCCHMYFVFYIVQSTDYILIQLPLRYPWHPWLCTIPCF